MQQVSQICFLKRDNIWSVDPYEENVKVGLCGFPKPVSMGLGVSF